ncbi:MAG: DUF2490 domain-containing protein [Prolixibacteraceae bacterium]|nr:DUF2490 domain-containing protein [Prolixibacteraceae bacterium]
MMKELFLTMMMINRKCIILFLILVWAVAILKDASAQTSDVRLRVSGKVQKEISKKIETSLEYEHRFDQNLSTFDKAFLEPSVTYSITKPLRVGVIYRIILDQNRTRKQQVEQRVAAYLRYRLKLDDFEIKFKTALQYGFDDITNTTFSYNQKLVNRNAIEIEYNWFGSKFTPFASAEIFYHINHPNGGILNQWKIKAGSSYKLSSKAKIQIYYLFENEFNVAYPIDAHVFGAGYSHQF